MKRNHPFLLLATVAILVIAFSSFSKGKKRFAGYKQEESGTYFLLHVKGPGKITVDTGGAVFVKIKFKTAQDSVFLDINKETNTTSYPMRVDKSEFKGDFLDIFLRLHAGDSASFFVRLDSLKKYYPKEFIFDQKYDTMQYLGFTVKVDSIYDRAKVTALRKAFEEQAKKDEAVKLQTKENEPAEIEKYIADHKITEKPSATGVYYIETEKGKGAPVKNGQRITVKYTGKFLDGEIFDSTDKSGQLFSFDVGAGQVIAGLEEGLLLMNNGGKATIIIPSAQAYSDGGGRFKPYATLIFEVEVISLQEPPVIAPR